MKDIRYDPEKNYVGASSTVFIEYYNRNIPKAFPRASLDTLQKFQETYPGLFNRKKEWIIDKHRKKFMDWLASYKEEDET